jgi:hypothetical protein
MNKIERAISDIKLHLGNLKMDKVILNAEISAFEKQLEALESIERNKSIPHSNPMVQIDDEHICKKRWDAWEEVKKSQTYEDFNEGAYVDGFTKGAKWVINQSK